MGTNDIQIRTREELLQELEAAQFRLAFFDLQEQESTRIEKQTDENDKIQRYIDIVKPDVLQLIDREVRKKHLWGLVRKNVSVMKQIGRVVAGVLLIVYIGFSAALAVSPTVRVKVMELLISVTDEYAQIQLEEKTDSYLSIPGDWLGEYYPSYIPDGYVFDRTYGNQSSVFSEYVNDSGYFLIFSENTSDTIMNMDIEGAEIVHTTVHDLPAAASIKGGNVILVWAEFNKYFYITIHGDLNTALKIARSVVRIR